MWKESGIGSWGEPTRIDLGGAMKTRSTTALFTAAALVVATFSAAPSIAQEIDFVIQAGATNPNDPSLAYEYTRFYPDTLRVHQGQTVSWKILGSAPGATGFHTVTFLPDGRDRPGLLREDEIPGYYNTTDEWFAPVGCGHVGEEPCLLQDTDTFVSSGIPIFFSPTDFSVTIDVPPGAYEYLCTVHASMTGTIEVVPDEEALKTQEQIDQETIEEVAADTAAADAVVAEDADPGFVIEDGRKIHVVLLGDSTPDNHVAIVQFLPGNLQIEAGDGVRWIYDDEIIDEIHSVSFPEELSGGFSPFPHGKAGVSFHPRCDFDDPNGGAPGIPGLWEVTPLPCEGNLELGVSTWMTEPTLAPGNDPSVPLAVHDSALLIPEGAPDQYRMNPGTGEPFPATFDAGFSNPGTYAYECNVHSDPMTGSITVV